MARGDKDAYTPKQKRKAAQIADSYEARGVPHAEAEGRAWATVNSQDGGGRRSGSGRARPSDARPSDARPLDDSHAARSEAARKGWETRRRNARDG